MIQKFELKKIKVTGRYSVNFPKMEGNLTANFAVLNFLTLILAITKQLKNIKLAGNKPNYEKLSRSTKSPISKGVVSIST